MNQFYYSWKKKSIIEFLVPNVRNDLSVYNCLPVISLHVTFNLSCSCFYFLGSDIHPNCFGFNSYNMFLNWLYAHIMTFSSYIQSSFLHLSLVNRGWNFVHLVNIRGSKGQGTWHPSFSRKKIVYYIGNHWVVTEPDPSLESLWIRIRLAIEIKQNKSNNSRKKQGFHIWSKHVSNASVFETFKLLRYFSSSI